MKHVTAPFSNLLGTTTSNLKPQHSMMGKITLMLLFLLISQAGIVAQTCTAPSTSDASATLPSSCTTIPTISGQSGNVFELTINPANAYTFTICFDTNTAGNSQFPQAELYDDLAGTFIAETGSADANNCTTVTYTPPVDCTASDMLIYLATYSHQCISDWRDLNINVTCEGCTVTCGAPRFVAATNSGCSANAFVVDAPAVAGSCAGNATTATPSAGIAAFATTMVDGSVSVSAGAPVGTHTITFAVEDCAGATVACDQTIIVEPVMACDDVVNITLSQFCELQVTPAMLLEAECADESQYEVNILGLTGDIISEPGLYEVQIIYNPTTPNSASGNYCWGFINAEDKSGPTCTIENEQINVSCGEDFDAGEPVFEDCSGVASSNMVTVEYGECGSLSFPFVANPNVTIPEPNPLDPAVIEFKAAAFTVDRVIVNMWTATDNNGVSSNACSQFIYIWRPSTVNPPLASITVECGSDIDQSTLAALDPQYVPFYTNPKYGADTNASNDLEFTLVDNDGDLQFLPITDVDHSVCKFTVNSTDLLLQELCGNTEKYIREFTVLNWCNGAIVVDGVKQVIKVADTVAPEFTDCPAASAQGGSFANPLPLFTTSSAQGECGFTGVLTAPNATDSCSEPISYSASIYTSGGTGNGYVLLTQVQDLSAAVTLDLRDYRVDFIATDDCNNDSDVCSVYYNVIDNDSPVAICDQQTTVSLTNVDNGTAAVCADNLDSGSYDNCSVTSRMVKRMGADDDTFAACLNVTCDDAGQEFMVVLRVVDAAGNSNICMVTVDVQDKVGAQIVCPANTTVTCLDPTDIANTGTVIANASAMDGINGFAFDNCAINAVDNTDISNTVDCGAGVIEREFTAFTSSGVASCVQTITVEPDYNYFVTFPADVTIEGCADVTNIDMVGEPIISGVTCSEVGVAVSDQTFVISSGACNRILRTFIVQNTCVNSNSGAATTDGGIPVVGDPLKFQDDGDGYFSYTQTIDVVDEVAPVFAVCENQFFDTFNNDCTGNVLVDITATDNCSNDLTYFWKVDLFSDSTDDLFGDDASIEGVLPVGTHTAFAQAFDGCGNTETCTFTILVSDVKNPTPYCNSGINTVIMNGDARSVSVWAVDLVEVSSGIDNCTATEDLVYTVSLATNPNPTAPSSASEVTITCDQLDTDAAGNALATTFAVQVFVQDQAGNWDFCTSQIEIIDTENDCGTSAGVASAAISGRIFNEQDEDVEDVMVQVAGDDMNMNPYYTDVDGQFEFSELAVNNDYSVQPSKDINPANGVSTFDLVLLTRHILGIDQLDSPYKIIAADVNGDKTLDINDLIELRQLILFSIEGFSSQRSWSFIDAEYQFNNELNPLSEAYPEVIDFNDLSANADANFIGMKLGDLDGDSYANRLLDVAPRSFYPTASLRVNDAAISAGETVKIPFTSEDMGPISAMQFTVEFDQNALEFVGVSAGALEVTEGNIGTTMLDEGVLTFSWNTNSKEVDVQSNALFTLEFTAKQASSIADAISLSSKYTPSVAFNNAGQQNVELDLISENGTVLNGNGFELFQNLPNPFLNNTVIGFNLPEAASATLRIMDVSGKELRVITNSYAKGYNKIDLDVSSLDVKGVLFYQLETASHAATMKMIIIE